MKIQKILLFLFILSGFLLTVLFFRANSLIPLQTKLRNSANYNPKKYSPTEINELLNREDNKYLVIDVRTKKEFDKGHVPGAVNADYFDKEALLNAAADKIPITYDGFSTMRGPYAAYILYQSGYRNVGILIGGLVAWAEDIGELESIEGKYGSVFLHPKNIFPERTKRSYPKNQGTAEFNIEARKFAFLPDKLEVKHGQQVRLNLVSKDVIHGFAMPEFGIEVELLPNVQKKVEFTADRKGNFPFITNVISGNDYVSMVGNIIVD